MKRGSIVIKNKIMFMGLNIPLEVKSIMEQAKKGQANPYEVEAFEAGVNYTMRILEMVCTDDSNHVVAHIPELEVGEEFIYDDFKKLEHVKACVKEIEM